MATLNIAIGIPGAGKSTYLKKLNAVYVSSDEIRKELFGDEGVQDNPQKVFAVLNSRVSKALKEGKDVTYDATNVNRKSRKQIFKDYKGVADKIVAYYFDIPVEEAIKRNNARQRVVPEEAIMRMYGNLNPPTLEEGFDEILRIETVVKDGKIDTYFHVEPERGS